MMATHFTLSSPSLAWGHLLPIGAIVPCLRKQMYTLEK